LSALVTEDDSNGFNLLWVLTYFIGEQRKHYQSSLYFEKGVFRAGEVRDEA
jgi:hypothetical protein